MEQNQLTPEAPFAAVHFKEAEIQEAEASADQAALFLRRYPNLIKHAGLFAMLDGQGNMGALIHRDTRYHASHLVVNGVMRAGLITGGIVFATREAHYDDAAKSWRFVLENEATSLSGPDALPPGALCIESTLFIAQDAAYRQIEIHHRGQQTLPLTLDIIIDNRMIDIFDLRGDAQKKWGHYRPSRFDSDTVLAVYQALDGVQQAVRLRFGPAPQRLDDRHAHFECALAAGERWTLWLEAKTFEAGPQTSIPLNDTRRAPQRAYDHARQKLSREVAAARHQQASLTTNNDALNHILERSAYDVSMLVTPTENGPFPMAGMPWFNNVFGRDSLITARLELWRNPDLAKGVLLHLAANQATETNLAAAAQPGKIAHEIRLCEMARTGQVPYRRYYGSVDAPALFVMLTEAYVAQTGDRDTLRLLWPHVLAALQWMREGADPDRSGLIKYARMTQQDLANQGWEDSGDSVHHDDGLLAGGAIALLEVQGYAYAARQGASRLAHMLGDGVEAGRLQAEADALRRKIDDLFWDDEWGCYGMAIDARGLCRTLDSNIGHLLLTHAVSGDRAAALADVLLSEKFFSGWGIRTKPIGGPRYQPASYHNGSIWPHSNALIALGLVDYGYKEQAATILEALTGAAGFFHDRCPELFSGATRQAGTAPEPYPNANPVQAWSAAAIPGMVAALLGLRVDVENKQALFDRPYLPDLFKGEVILQRLRVGGGSVSVRLEGKGYDVKLAVMNASDGANAKLVAGSALIQTA